MNNLRNLRIGQRVRYTHVLKRQRNGRAYEWKPARLPIGYPAIGHVVGIRQLQNGEVYGGDEYEPVYFISEKYFKAVLIAPSLYRNPIRVLPEHLQIIGEEAK